MPIDTRELLDRQRKRLLATILGYCETQEWYARLSRREREQFRERVLTAASAYHDLMLDLLRSTDDGEFNEYALSLLDKIYDKVRQ